MVGVEWMFGTSSAIRDAHDPRIAPIVRRRAKESPQTRRRVCGPLRRTIPRAAPPGGEAMAAMVSSSGYMGTLMRCLLNVRLQRVHHSSSYFVASVSLSLGGLPRAGLGLGTGLDGAGWPPASVFGRNLRSARPHRLDAMK